MSSNLRTASLPRILARDRSDDVWNSFTISTLVISCSLLLSFLVICLARLHSRRTTEGTADGDSQGEDSSDARKKGRTPQDVRDLVHIRQWKEPSEKEQSQSERTTSLSLSSNSCSESVMSTDQSEQEQMEMGAVSRDAKETLPDSEESEKDCNNNTNHDEENVDDTIHVISIKNGCAICLEAFCPSDVVGNSRNKACTHTFHLECITEWLVSHDCCPVCRSAYVPDDPNATQQEAC